MRGELKKMLKYLLVTLIIIVGVIYAITSVGTSSKPIVPINPPARPPPIVNDEYRFDGSSYISLPKNRIVDDKKTLSIRFDIRTVEKNGFVMTMGDMTTTPPSSSFCYVYVHDGTVWLTVGGQGGGFRKSSSLSINDNRWHTITVSREQEDTWRLYIDDELTISATKRIDRIKSGYLYVGFTASSNVGMARVYANDRSLNGLVGCVRNIIVNRTQQHTFIVDGIVRRTCVQV